MNESICHEQDGSNAEEYLIRTMDASDYTDVLKLWEGKPELRIDTLDSRNSIIAYLEANPGLSFVAIAGGAIVGTLLCGTDMRRGYLQHLYVLNEYRHRGIASALLNAAITAFKNKRIKELRLFVLKGNMEGSGFWMSRGWQERDDIGIYSFQLEE